VPIFHVSKALGHSDVTVTARHYSFLSPGVSKEAPDVLERFVFSGHPARCEEREQTNERFIET
jgi:hypothetical protein